MICAHPPITDCPVASQLAVLSNARLHHAVTSRSEVIDLAGDDTAALVLRAKTGDRAAFAALAQTHLRAAHSVALAILGRPSDAEDIAQDSFLRAFERLGTCREPERFAGWLLQIVRNQARNALASRKLRDVSEHESAQEPLVEHSLPDSSVHRMQLLRALDSLTVTRREVVLLHELDGWTHAEIAETLQISELMSRQHLFLARRELREQLDAKITEVEHG